MATNVTLNGTVYSIPAEGDSSWGTNVSNYLIAISTACLQRSGGSFTLTADIDFGTSFGLKTAYIKSKATNTSGTGFIRLGNTESVKWRNAANSADLDLTLDASDVLKFNGNPILFSGSGSLTNLIVNSDINTSAAIAYSKLNLSSSIVNADVSATAAIAYSKLNLSGSIVNADISSSAAIDLSKLSALALGRVVQTNASTGLLEASSISNTTLSYLDATSSIQTQLNGKQASGSYALTNGNLSQFASTTSSELAGVISDETGSGSLVFSNSPTLVTPVLGVATATSINSTSIPSSKTLVVTTDKLSVHASTTSAELAGVISDETGSGSLVFSNSPSLVSPTADVLSLTDQGSTPSSPSAGTHKAYIKSSTGKLTILDSTGSETAVGGGSGGSKNYLTDYKGNTGNGDFELGTTGWSLGHTSVDATTKFVTGTPTFGSGFAGGGVLSLGLVSGGSQLAGLQSLSYTSTTTSTQGDFFSSNAFTIDLEDQSKLLSFKFSYKANTGVANVNFSGTSSNSFGIAIYDVTNSAWIQPAGVFSLNQNSGVGIANGTFQSSSNSTSYRIVVYNANASSGLFSILFDSMFVGPQTVSYGAAMSDWTSFTPTGSWSNTTYTGLYKRVGDSAALQYTLTMTGAPTATNLTLNMPSGMVIDTSKLTSSFLFAGGGNGADVGVQPYGQFFLEIISSTSFIVRYQSSTAAVAAPVTNTAPFAWGNTDIINLTAHDLPIVGWSSNTVQSSSTASNIVTTQAYRTSALTGLAPNNSTVQVTFNTVTFDKTGSFNTTNGSYVVPVSGTYNISAALYIGGTNTLVNSYGVNILKGATFGAATQVITGPLYNNPTAGNAVTPSASGKIDLVAGDILWLGLFGTGNNSASTLSLGGLNTPQFASWNITRDSGPATIQASETVTARYLTSAGQSITNGATPIVIDYGTKDYDSHNAVTTGASWKFTAPISGVYAVKASAMYNSGSFSSGSGVRMYITKNGSTDVGITFVNTPITGTYFPGSMLVNGSVKLLAGEFVQIRTVHSEATARSLLASDIYHVVCIEKVGN